MVVTLSKIGFLKLFVTWQKNYIGEDKICYNQQNVIGGAIIKYWGSRQGIK